MNIRQKIMVWYAIGMSAMVFVLIILLYFVEIPEQNKSIIEISIGTIIGICLGTPVGYYYGNSDKHDDI